jgi:hypothetical protein
MTWQHTPQLVTIEGDEEEELSFLGSDPLDVSELLGIDYSDARFLTANNQLSADQVAYLNAKYPEYLGIWPIIAMVGKAVVGAIPKAVKAIKKAVKKKKTAAATKKTAAKVAEEKKQAAIVAEQKRVIAEQEKKEAEKKKMMITIGIPVAALALFMLMKKKG